MGVFRQFPYSNFHEMNMDEIIKIIKDMLEEWATYHAEWDEWMDQMEDDWSNYQDVMNTAWQNMQNFINNYFDNLDVQEEINNKIVSMIQTGEFGQLVNEYIPPAVSAWLALHITEPTGVVIDTSLTVSGACADAKVTGDNIRNLQYEVDNKYTKYGTIFNELSLDCFSICPSQYRIVTYDNQNALQHDNLAGSGLTYLISRFADEIKDVKFKLHYGFFSTTPAICVNIACNENKSIGVFINATSGNIQLFTPTSITQLPGIYRNGDCRTIVVDDTIHLKKDGTKVALYLVDNDIDVPIWEQEWVDVEETYGVGAGITSNDVGFGFTSANDARNEPLIYDFSYIYRDNHFADYDSTNRRLEALEDNSGTNPYLIDLFLFMGQSNIAGRGNGSQAPDVNDGAGHEFRAISDPNRLYPIIEPFGLNENVENAIYDYLGGVKAKTGDLVPAFVNAYYKYTKTPIVGVSASEGGTRISYWLPGQSRYADALNRWNTAISWLENNGYTIRHKYILWCQGESDGDDNLSGADYKTRFETLWAAWQGNGAEKIFVIKIGNYNGDQGYDYNTIMTAQNEICQTMENVIMVSTDFAGMKARDLMKDAFHYKQAGYNEVGEYSGINTAIYVNTGKEPTMFDTQNRTLYYTHKN